MQTSLLLETPSSNTGLTSQIRTPTLSRPNTTINYSVDNLSLLWDKSPDLDIFLLCKKLLSVEFDFSHSFPMTVGVRWEHTNRGSLGCLYMERETSVGVRCRLSLSGKACASVPIELLLHFLSIVSSSPVEVSCSRIDICLDDYTKRLTFENIWAALESGNHSGFRTSHAIKNFGNKRGGWTVNLGSRQSSHFVRIYDKSAESKGRIDSIRWESEFKHEKAQAIFKSLAAATTCVDALKLVKGYTFGKFHFIDKTNKNLDRCNALDWWLDFLLFVMHEQAEILVDKVVTSIESSVLWIRRQVEKSLARISRAFGTEKFEEFLDDCLVSGRNRLKAIDNLLIVEYMNAQFIV